ncbi:MAG: MFS transporter, partial [Bacteroidales bacterium]|nr:MFS transporter [Bacteroidales bacterium]
LLMYGLSNLPGWPALLMSLAGAGGLLWFIRLEMKTALPVLDVRMFKQNLVYGLSNLSAFINYAATFAVSFMLSLYLQYVHLLTPRDAGLILMIQPAVMALVSVGAGRLSDKWSASALASIGMAISALGLFLLIFLGQQTTFVYILASLATLGLGFGLFSSPNTNVVMSSVDKSLYGVASATLATMRNLGMLFSMALASLAVHVFLGSRHMSADTTGEFLQASRLVFILFSAFCLLGVFTSMQRGRRIPVQ